MKFQTVVQQWVPESMDWKECVAIEYLTYEEAEAHADKLRRPGRQAFVRNAP